ncbi:3-dehydroquinate dehydratase, partial [Aeropyrum pernix]
MEASGRICTVVPVEDAGEAAMLALSSPTGCVELRLDFYPGDPGEALEQLATRLHSPARVVVTLRSAGHGGLDRRARGERRAVLARLEDLAPEGWMVDYEVEDLHASSGCSGCIASSHPTTPPTPRRALEEAAVAERLGASAYKLVYPGVEPWEQAAAAWLVAEAGGFATSFTLGPGTLASRLTALALGAPLVFGSHPRH